MSEASTPATTKPLKRANLYKLRKSIISDLAQSLAAASARIRLAAAGQFVFADDRDLKSTLAILAKLPHILPLVPKQPPPPPPPRIRVAKRGQLPDNLPKPQCPLCLGIHWVQYCPKKDTVDDHTHTRLMSQQSRWYAEVKKALEEQEIEK